MGDLTYDGNLKVSWVPAIANTSAPTAAEMAAGISLEDDITPDGLSTPFDTASVDTSSLASTFSSSAPGRRTPQISITYKRFKDDGTATDAETNLTYRAAGFLVVRRTKASSIAFAAADKVEVYPSTCGQPSPANAAPNEVQKATVSLMPSADPQLNAVVAA